MNMPLAKCNSLSSRTETFLIAFTICRFDDEHVAPFPRNQSISDRIFNVFSHRGWVLGIRTLQCGEVDINQEIHVEGRDYAACVSHGSCDTNELCMVLF
jgi:hypothetical protein